MAKRTVEPGRRYRDVRPGIYGRLADSDWIVKAVKIDAQGIQHARLVSVADPTVQKTLAAEVLVDPARFGSADSPSGSARSRFAPPIRTGGRLAPMAVAVTVLVAVGWTGGRWLVSLGDPRTAAATETAPKQPASARSPQAVQPALAAEALPDLAELKPLIAPSSEPPTRNASAPDLAKSKHGEVRRPRVNSSSPAPTANGGDHDAGNRSDDYASRNEIYQPGSRPPGW